MTIIIKIIAYPMITALVIAFAVLLGVYLVDALHDIFVNGRAWLIIIGFFGGTLLIIFVYWAVILAMAPLRIASGANASISAQLIGLTMAPVGLLGGFLLWQVENWLIYGFLDIEPWLYNRIFDSLSLAV